MTRLRRACVPVFLVALLASACGGDDDPEPMGVQEVANVSVDPGTATLASFGATQQLSASATDASGGNVAGATFTWSSSAAAVATVSPTGLVTAVSNGTATVTATADGISGTASITVAQAAATISLVLADDTLTAGGTSSRSVRLPAARATSDSRGRSTPSG